MSYGERTKPRLSVHPYFLGTDVETWPCVPSLGDQANTYLVRSLDVRTHEWDRLGFRMAAPQVQVGGQSPAAYRPPCDDDARKGAPSTTTRANTRPKTLMIHHDPRRSQKSRGLVEKFPRRALPEVLGTRVWTHRSDPLPLSATFWLSDHHQLFSRRGSTSRTPPEKKREREGSK